MKQSCNKWTVAIRQQTIELICNRTVRYKEFITVFKAILRCSINVSNSSTALRFSNNTKAFKLLLTSYKQKHIYTFTNYYN